MWKKKSLKIMLLLLLVFFAFWPAPIILASGQDLQPQIVQVPLPKLIELKGLINLQEKQLTELRESLSRPQVTLLEQKEQLQKAQSSIVQLESNLEKAQNSLNNAQILIAEQNSSLMNLSEELRIQREKEKLNNLRSIGYSLVGGVLLGMATK